MTFWRILTLTFVLVSVSVPLMAAITTWFGPTVWDAVLGLAPPVVAALVVVLYFEWRAKLQRRIRADALPDEELDAVA